MHPMAQSAPLANNHFTHPPVSLRTGVDLIEIERLRLAIDRHGERFLRRVYTATELAQCRSRGRRSRVAPPQYRIESLAGRFAAKEAAAKALGTGIWCHEVTWTDLEIVRNPDTGAPILFLHNAAQRHAASLSLAEWSLSISHSRIQAIAFVAALAR